MLSSQVHSTPPVSTPLEPCRVAPYVNLPRISNIPFPPPSNTFSAFDPAIISAAQQVHTWSRRFEYITMCERITMSDICQIPTTICQIQCDAYVRYNLIQVYCSWRYITLPEKPLIQRKSKVSFSSLVNVKPSMVWIVFSLFSSFAAIWFLTGRSHNFYGRKNINQDKEYQSPKDQ